jgi:hypothetical protein
LLEVPQLYRKKVAKQLAVKADLIVM